MKKDNLLNKKLFSILLSIILLGEMTIEFISFYRYLCRNTIESETINNSTETVEKDLNEIINELNYNNISFFEIRKEKNGYNIKVIVEGNDRVFRDKLKYINKYLIKDYELKSKNDNIKVIATLNY